MRSHNLGFRVARRFLNLLGKLVGGALILGLMAAVAGAMYGGFYSIIFSHELQWDDLGFAIGLWYGAYGGLIGGAAAGLAAELGGWRPGWVFGGLVAGIAGLWNVRELSPLFLGVGLAVGVSVGLLLAHLHPRLAPSSNHSNPRARWMTLGLIGGMIVSGLILAWEYCTGSQGAGPAGTVWSYVFLTPFILVVVIAGGGIGAAIGRTIARRRTVAPAQRETWIARPGL